MTFTYHASSVLKLSLLWLLPIGWRQLRTVRSRGLGWGFSRIMSCRNKLVFVRVKAIEVKHIEMKAQIYLCLRKFPRFIKLPDLMLCNSRLLLCSWKWGSIFMESHPWPLILCSSEWQIHQKGHLNDLKGEFIEHFPRMEDAAPHLTSQGLHLISIPAPVIWISHRPACNQNWIIQPLR